MLLKNDGVLPMTSSALRSSHVAVIGPFARCTGASKKDQNGTCYLHSYNGNPDYVVSIYDAVKNASGGGGGGGGGDVTFALGSNATCGWRCGWGMKPPPACWTEPGAAASALDDAVAAATVADVTILAVGLGSDVEAEGCDRFNLTLPAVQQELLARVGKVAKKLVVIVVSAGGVDFDDSMANAVLWAP